MFLKSFKVSTFAQAQFPCLSIFVPLYLYFYVSKKKKKTLVFSALLRGHYGTDHYMNAQMHLEWIQVRQRV